MSAYVERARPAGLAYRTNLRAVRSNRRTPRTVIYRRSVRHGSTLMRSVAECSSSKRWTAVFVGGELRRDVCDEVARSLAAAIDRVDVVDGGGLWKLIIRLEHDGLQMQLARRGEPRCSVTVEPESGDVALLVRRTIRGLVAAVVRE